jgi:hypothetical protein
MNIELIPKECAELYRVTDDIALSYATMEISELHSSMQALAMELREIAYEASNGPEWSTIIQNLYQSFIKIINDIGKFVTYIINYILSMLFNLDIPTYEAVPPFAITNKNIDKLQQWYLINMKRLQTAYGQNTAVMLFNCTSKIGINTEILLNTLIKMLTSAKSMIMEKNTMSANTAQILYTMYTQDAHTISTLQSKMFISGNIAMVGSTGIKESNITIRDIGLFFTTIPVQLIEIETLWNDIKASAPRIKRDNISLLQNHITCIQVTTVSVLTMMKKMCGNMSYIVSTLYNAKVIATPGIK